MVCIIMVVPDKKPKTTPRDFFLNLLSIVALYWTATSFGILIFQYINILVPDVLDVTRYGGDIYGAIRFPVASLFIIFPVYVWSAWFLEKEYKKAPHKREISIHRWLVYLTLFIAALAIIGDLVALVFRFLEGEITTRFILKALTMFLIAGSVFYYYLSGLRKQKDKFMKIFRYGVIAIVSVSVLMSFFVVGSPAEQKNRRLDTKRVSDLQYLQSEIVNFWQGKDRLPDGLSELEDDLRGIRIPLDPETGTQYAYNIVGEEVFELCATFGTDSDGSSVEPLYYPYSDGSWEHGIGRVCFERTIDPDFFEDMPKPVTR